MFPDRNEYLKAQYLKALTKDLKALTKDKIIYNKYQASLLDKRQKE
jgi:hypothetical protein